MSAQQRQQDIASRIHILSIQLSLTHLTNIYDVAFQLLRGTISNPPPSAIPLSTLSYPAYQGVRIPRLDALVLNAGIGGWTHLDWLGFTKKALLKGWVEAVTFADYKIATVGKTISALSLSEQNIIVSDVTADADTTLKTKQKTMALASKVNDEQLGEVFAANVFGHYIFVHEVMPLLARTPDSVAAGVPVARIIWQSSIEPLAHHLVPTDIQGLCTSTPYESTKRLTDVLALSSHLPSVRNKAAASYFVPPSWPEEEENHDNNNKVEKTVPPNLFVAHPGVLVTTIFPLPRILHFFYWLGLLLARWLGSPWHTCEPYIAAFASVWLILETEDGLTARQAKRSKWGSATDRFGRAACKRSEVALWGWEGKAEDFSGVAAATDDKEEEGILGRQVGRWSGAKATTKEDIEEFEILGQWCWSEMEQLRLVWDARIKGAKKNV